MSHAPFIPAYCNLALAIIKEEASSVSHLLDIFQRAANGPVDLALVLFVIFALIKLPRIYKIPKPTYVGGKREEGKLSMLLRDIGNFSP